MDDLDSLLDWIDQVGSHHRKLQQSHLANTRALNQDRVLSDYKTKLRKQIVDAEFTKLGSILADDNGDDMEDDSKEVYDSPEEPLERDIDVDDAESDLESSDQHSRDNDSLTDGNNSSANQEDSDIEIVEVLSNSDDDDHQSEPDLDDFHDVDNEFDEFDDIDHYDDHDGMSEFDTAHDIEAQLVDALMGGITHDESVANDESIVDDGVMADDDVLADELMANDESMADEEAFANDVVTANDEAFANDEVIADDDVQEVESLSDDSSNPPSELSEPIERSGSAVSDLEEFASFPDEPLDVESDAGDADNSEAVAAASLAWLANAAIEASQPNDVPLRNSDYAADVELTATDNAGTDGIYDGLEEATIALAEGVNVPVLLTNGNGHGSPITLKSQSVIEDNQTEGSLADEEREGLSEWLRKESKSAEVDDIEVAVTDAERDAMNEPEQVLEEPRSTRSSFSFLPPTPPSIFQDPINNPEVRPPTPIFRTVKEEPIETLRKLRHTQASYNITLKVLRQLEEELGVDSTDSAAMKSATKRACDDLESMASEGSSQNSTSDILHRLEQEFGDIRKPVLKSIPDEDEDDEQIEEDGVKSTSDDAAPEPYINTSSNVKQPWGRFARWRRHFSPSNDNSNQDIEPAIIEPVDNDHEVLVEYAHDTVVHSTVSVFPSMVEEAEDVVFTARNGLIEDLAEGAIGAGSPIGPSDVTEVDETAEVLVILDENQEFAPEVNTIAPTSVVELGDDDESDDAGSNITHNVEVSEVTPQPTRKRVWTLVYDSIVDVPRKLFKRARDEARFCEDSIDATVNDLSEAVIDAAGDMVESVGNSLHAVDKIIEEVESVEVDDVAETAGQIMLSLEEVVNEAEQMEVDDVTKPIGDFSHTVEEAVEEADQIEVDDVVDSIGAAFKAVEDVVDEAMNVEVDNIATLETTDVHMENLSESNSPEVTPVVEGEEIETAIAQRPEEFYLEKSDAESIDNAHQESPEVDDDTTIIEVPILESLEDSDEGSTSDDKLSIIQLATPNDPMDIEGDQSEDKIDDIDSVQDSASNIMESGDSMGGNEDDKEAASSSPAVDVLLDNDGTESSQSKDNNEVESDTSFAERRNGFAKFVESVTNVFDDDNAESVDNDDEDDAANAINDDDSESMESKELEPSNTLSEEMTNAIDNDEDELEVELNRRAEAEDVVDQVMNSIAADLVDTKDGDNPEEADDAGKDVVASDEPTTAVDSLISQSDVINEEVEESVQLDIETAGYSEALPPGDNSNLSIEGADNANLIESAIQAAIADEVRELSKNSPLPPSRSLDEALNMGTNEENFIANDSSSEDQSQDESQDGNEIEVEEKEEVSEEEEEEEEEDADYTERSSEVGEQNLLDVVTAALEGIDQDLAQNTSDDSNGTGDNDSGPESPPYTAAITPPVLEPVEDSSNSDDDYIIDESFGSHKSSSSKNYEFMSNDLDDDDDDDDSDYDDNVDNIDDSWVMVPLETDEQLSDDTNSEVAGAISSFQEADLNSDEQTIVGNNASSTGLVPGIDFADIMTRDGEGNTSDTENTEESSSDESDNERYRDLQQIQHTLENSLAACERTLEENIRLNEELRAEYDSNENTAKQESPSTSRELPSAEAEASMSSKPDESELKVPETTPTPRSPRLKKEYSGPDHKHDLDDPSLDDVPPENLPHIKARVLGLDIDERSLGELEPQRLLRSGHRFGQVFSEEPIIEQLRHISGTSTDEQQDGDEVGSTKMTKTRGSRRRSTSKREKTTNAPLSAFEAVTQAASQGHSVHDSQNYDQSESLVVPKIRVSRRGRSSRVSSGEKLDHHIIDGPSSRTRSKSPVKFESDPASPVDDMIHKPLGEVDLKPEAEEETTEPTDLPPRTTRKRTHESTQGTSRGRRTRKTRKTS